MMRKLMIFVWMILAGHFLNAQVLFVAHRGESFLAPENTIASANLAWELNDEAVEIDIHMSADKKLMVIHDSNTRRTAGQEHIIKESNSEDLRKLDVGSFKNEKYKGQKIPYLEEIIQTIPPNKMLIVEIKCPPDVLPVIKAAVKDNVKLKQLVFIAFDWQTIVETKKTFPENLCYWLSGKKEEIFDKMNELPAVGIDGLDLNKRVIDEEVMNRAKQLKLDVWAYTVDDPSETKRLINLGVTAITSNRPNWLKSQINSEK